MKISLEVADPLIAFPIGLFRFRPADLEAAVFRE
jgi:hypothetical protein